MKGTSYKQAMRERNVVGMLVQYGHRLKFRRFHLANPPRVQQPHMTPTFMQRSKWGRTGPSRTATFTLGDVIDHNNPKRILNGHHKSFIT